MATSAHVSTTILTYKQWDHLSNNGPKFGNGLAQALKPVLVDDKEEK